MDFAKLKARLAKAVLRDDLVDSYGDFINEGLREIQNRRSWSFMKRTVFVTIPVGNGNESVALLSDFKELQKQPAVEFIADEGGYIPAEVVFEEQQINRVWAFGGTPIMTWPPRVFLEISATGAKLGMIEPMTEAFNFRVKYYAYLPDLSADGDLSPLAVAYPNMVIEKAKAIAFSGINDREAVAAEGAFEKKLAEATRQDAYSEVAGRVLHM